jgi:hypothetical protein
MAAPQGQWHINANGFKGTLNITTDAAGHVTGTANIDVGVTNNLQGVWSETAQEITFNRLLPGGAVQTYTGYLFTSKDPLFMGQGPPEPNPDFRLLTGFFEALSSPGRPRFGWMARQNI